MPVSAMNYRAAITKANITGWIEILEVSWRDTSRD